MAVTYEWRMEVADYHEEDIVLSESADRLVDVLSWAERQPLEPMQRIVICLVRDAGDAFHIDHDYAYLGEDGELQGYDVWNGEALVPSERRLPPVKFRKEASRYAFESAAVLARRG